MTAREIKNHAEVPPPRKEIYSIATLGFAVQLAVLIVGFLVPGRDSLRDVVEANRILKEQFDAHMAEDRRKWEAQYQKELRDAESKAEERAAIKRIDSYFDTGQANQRRQ